MPEVARPIDSTLIEATIQSLQRHAPFNRMAAPDLRWMVERLALVYFAPDATLLDPDAGVPAWLYVIKQGSVAGLDPGNAAPRWRLTPGEAFPIGALLGRRAVTSVYRAEGDIFCWRLSAADFATLLERSAPLREFCTHRLSSLLATSRRRMQRESSEDLMADPLAQPLADLLRREPVACGQDTPLTEALARMRAARVGSIVVCGRDSEPAGIFTLRDLRDRIALEALDLGLTMQAVMTPDPLTLPDHEPALQAALLMAGHGFHHVVVTRAGRLAGVVSESDLFALRRVGLTSIGEAIRAADDIDALRRAAGELRRLAEALMAQGVAAEQLTRIVSTLNDLLTARLVELEAGRAGTNAGDFCWLALGSEGRHEQTLATDQDNAIVFDDTAGAASARYRQRLLDMAQRVNEGLAACGFPLCKGEIMAGNSRWCLGLREWQACFEQWMHTPDGEALLNASIFFDFRGSWGALDLARSLRQWLARNAHGRDVFLRLMAQNALRNQPPLGVLREFSLARHEDTPDSLDLKVNGVTPFVDAARVLALAAGVEHTGTAERLRAVAQARGLD
ncbi:MAG: CBS domain-containing protein, partial [Burkholderiales bacterium]|nr:CBS domain-containing protein [Burkholderiales bacterium]